MPLSHSDETLAALPPDVRALAEAVSARRLSRCLSLLDQRFPDLAVIAEAVHRRHNVSAILRSAEAFGVHEAHLVAPRFGPAASAAKGAERWLDLHFHDDVEGPVESLVKRGFRLYVCDLSDSAIAPAEIPLDAPVALLFGAELGGVSERARELADGAVCIPMVGVTQSLNVSAAAAVILATVTARLDSEAAPRGIQGERRADFLRDFLRSEASRKRSFDHLFDGPDGQVSTEG